MKTTVAGADECGDSAGVGGESARKDEGGFSVFELGQLLLELSVEVAVAGDEWAGPGAPALLVEDGADGLGESGVGGEAEVVVGAEVDELVAVELNDCGLGPHAVCELAAEAVAFQAC